MFIKNYHLIFFTFLIAGSLIAISANSWFTSWLGLEINLISIIPLMLIRTSPKLTEAAIKYFLSQAIASIILILSISINFFSSELISLESLEIFLCLALTIKAGLAPLHYWFPQVIQNLLWPQCFIIFTWQKIAPLILLRNFSLNLIFFISSASALIGCLGGFNQIILKLLLTYSSISHSGWIIIACLIRLTFWRFYFLIYSLLSAALIIFFFSNQNKKISEIFLRKDTLTNKLILSLNILSLGGLPPLLGFSAKLTLILTGIKYISRIIFIPLIIRSLISLFFYSRIIYSNLINFTPKTSNFKKIEHKSLPLVYTLSTFFNLTAPFILILR